MNVAVVDIGSNSVRLLVAELEQPANKITELHRESNITRLGQGVDTANRLADEAIKRTYDVLDRYAKTIAEHDCERAIAVMTSAVRDSANRDEFAHAVQTEYDLEPHILVGDEEARLTYLGATSERDPADKAATLVLDIGGGSTEMIVGEGPDLKFRVSTQAGVVRQTERHLHDDPPTQQQIDELVADVRNIIEQAVPADTRTAVGHGIGVAGTATSLAAIAQHLEPYDPDKVHGYRISAAEAERILHELAALPLNERREVPGLHPDRAPTIIAGVLIFGQVVKLFGLDEIEISEHDILRGAVLGLIAN